MSGALRHSWEYLGAELWIPLAEYTSQDESAPEGLFGDLFAAADEFLSPRPSIADLEEVRNNPENAKQRFLGLKGTDFTSESDIVLFLEQAYALIKDYELPGYEVLYKTLVRDVIKKFNLRYRLDEPFVIRFMLPGSFANLYAELQRINTGHHHLSQLLTDFEKAFDRFARTEDETDLRQCIHMASNYAEGLASATLGNPTTRNTLGALALQLTDWPHDKVRDALINVYHFCSDYPGIRHGGSPQNAKRNLASRDLTLASLVLLSFAGHLSPLLDERAVLGL